MLYIFYCGHNCCMESNFYDKVYKLVELIPFGRVTTFGEIARMMGDVKLARLVSASLQKENFKAIPVHRVVYKNGKLCKNFAFGGLQAQKNKLEEEGITIKNNKVDLNKYGFYFW